MAAAGLERDTDIIFGTLNLSVQVESQIYHACAEGKGKISEKNWGGIHDMRENTSEDYTGHRRKGGKVFAGN